MDLKNSKVGYCVVYPSNIRKKIEAFYFCQCSNITGTLRNNKEGNLEFEVSGYEAVLKGFLSRLNDYMGQDAICLEEREPIFSCDEGVFRIG